MSKRTLVTIKRDLEIALESFQAIESLASQAIYDGAASDVAKAMVPANLLMEDLLEQIRNTYSHSNIEKANNLTLHTFK